MGAGRECRYSGARRGIGGIRALGAPRGCWGPLGEHQRASGDVGVSGEYLGLAGSVGTQEPEWVKVA